MATFKAEVYAHQKKQDGTWNIKIRVTQNQKKRYLSTPWYVTKEDLTRGLKIKNQKYIDLTEKLIKKYRSICDGAGERLADMTVDDIVELVSSDRNDAFDLDIVEFGYKWIQEMQSTGHSGNASTYVCALKSLVKFVGRSNVSVKEVTARFLQDWAAWIAAQPGVSAGYAQHNYLNRLRAIHNRAKKVFNDEDAGVIRIPNSPFSHIDMPKIPIVRKRAITAEQLKAIADLEYTTIIQQGFNRFNFARDIFLLSFGLIGMNPVDLYYCTDYRKGRINYERIKTRNRRQDKAAISIRVEPEFEALFSKYRDPDKERVFCFYHHYSSVDSFSVALNKGLKKVGKVVGIDDLEFYAARHTWATIAVNEAGVDKYTVHEALNHVDDSMRVTDIYIKRNYDGIDQANRKVMNYLNLSLDDVEETSILP